MFHSGEIHPSLLNACNVPVAPSQPKIFVWLAIVDAISKLVQVSYLFKLSFDFWR